MDCAVRKAKKEGRKEESTERRKAGHNAPPNDIHKYISSVRHKDKEGNANTEYIHD